MTRSVSATSNAEARRNGFDTGVAAEYFVLSQLYRQGMEAYISQGNKSIDIRLVRLDDPVGPT